MKEQLDKESQKIESDRQLVYEFVKSDNWRIIKKRLIDKIFQLDSLTYNFDEKLEKNPTATFEEIGRHAIINSKVVGIILEWIREIEGEATIQGSKDMIEETKEETFIFKID